MNSKLLQVMGIAFGFSLLATCAAPAAGNGEPHSEPPLSANEATDENKEMLFDQADIELIYDVLFSEFDVNWSRIIVKRKWDIDESSHGQIDYFDSAAQEIIHEEPTKALGNRSLSEAVYRIREALAVSGEKCTHIEIHFSGDGQFNIVQGFGPFEMEYSKGFWPDDITAETYTYSGKW